MIVIQMRPQMRGSLQRPMLALSYENRRAKDARRP